MIAALIVASVYASPGSPVQTAPQPIEIRIPESLARFEIVPIPAGTVKQGNATVPVKALWVSRTEVTWDVYDIWAYRKDLDPKVVAEGKYDASARPSRPYGAADRGYGHAGYPAIGMTAKSAELFCQWLSQKTERKFRLPTVAEWEYLARAGAETEPTPLANVAWHWDNAEDKTWPVGKKAPNAWGLYDVLGNTAEWATLGNGQLVACGGSFMDKAAEVKFTSRKTFVPAWQQRDPQRPKSRWWLSDGPFIGFRVVSDRS